MSRLNARAAADRTSFGGMDCVAAPGSGADFPNVCFSAINGGVGEGFGVNDDDDDDDVERGVDTDCPNDSEGEATKRI